VSARAKRAWALAALLFVGLGVAAFFATHEQVDIQRALPPGAEARANPLHALTLGLRDAGQEVVMRGHLDLERDPPPPRGSIVLLYPEAQVETDAQAWALLDWVSTGGRLLLPMPRGDAAPALSAMLRDSFGVEAFRGAAAGESDCANLLMADGDHSADWLPVCGTPFAVEGAIEDAVAWPNAAQARFARLPYGEGEVLLLADLTQLDNSRIQPIGRRGDSEEDLRAVRFRDQSTLLMATLASPLLEGDAVWVIAFRGGSLTALLASRGWPFFLGSGLALMAWLLWRSQRLGPVVPSPPARRRALMEHIDAAGQFVFRSDHGAALHAALREAVLERLARRHALAQLDDAALAHAIADRSRLPREAIASALTLPPRAAPEAFRDAVATLSTVLHRL
jgi:hypothetical protein